MIQILILAGGNGRTRYRCGDILFDGPSRNTTHRKYQLPFDIATEAKSRLEAIKSNLKNRMFVNNPQVKLCDFLSGGANGTGGLTDLPLRMELGWTEYFYTRLTNPERGHRLPDGQSIELKYGHELDDLGDDLSIQLLQTLSCQPPSWGAC